MKITNVQRRRDYYFQSGFMAAVSAVLTGHGDTLMARFLLKEYGKVNTSLLGDYDKDKLKAFGIKLSKEGRVLN